MDNSPNLWLDLIIIVIVGLFIYSRFFSKALPRDEGKSAKNIREAYGIKPAADKEKVVPMTPKTRRRRVSAEELEKLDGLDRIRAMDPAFDDDSFMEGAKAAYGMFYTARNARDMDTLESLVAPRLLDDVLDELDAKNAKSIDVDKVENAEVVDTRINGRTLIIDVKYTARHKDGSKAKAVQQVWTWARNVDADDPNWELELMRPVS